VLTAENVCVWNVDGVCVERQTYDFLYYSYLNLFKFIVCCSFLVFFFLSF